MEAKHVHISVRSSPLNSPSRASLLAALKQCGKKGNLEQGKTLHLNATESGLATNIYIASALITMYSNCGSMFHAQAVFDNMPYRDVVSWNTLILGYVENGESSVAMELFMRMNCEPDCVTYVAALKACTGLLKLDRKLCLDKVLTLHTQARELGFVSRTNVSNTLIDMYSKCGSMIHARGVFENMTRRDVVSWTSLILGYVESGESLVAVEFFRKMDCEPNSFTFVAALKAYTNLAKQGDRQLWLIKGMDIHRQATERGCASNKFVGNSLVEMYSNCRSMLQARGVFDNMSHRDTVSWTSLILGYVENGESSVAMELFRSMDCEKDSVTFVAALKACIGLEVDPQHCLKNGIEIHRQARVRGYDTHIIVANTLVDMYSKCRSMKLARSVFNGMSQRNVISWNILISGYVENGECLVAIELFNNMDCEPDCVTFVAALKACIGLENGMEIHRRAREHGFDTDKFVGNNLIDMYSRCNSMNHAREVFDSMSYRDVVSWNILISGYLENGKSLVAVDMFTKMDVEPDSVTFVATLKACACLGALEVGQGVVHSHVCRLGLEEDQVLATCLVDFYGKCSNVATATHVLDGMECLDSIVSWNALISGYSSFGDTPRVFSLVPRVLECGVRMDSVTFGAILTACSRAGTVDDGKKWFMFMVRYGITPSLEHYHCIIDMLGRANRLQEALLLVKSMPFEANFVAWMSLLGACRNFDNLEVGKAAFERLLACCKQDGESAAPAYVLMGDIYKNLGIQQDWERMTKGE